MDSRFHPLTRYFQAAANSPLADPAAPPAGEPSATAIYASARSLQQRIRLALVNSRKPLR
jgi:hypothetical protein